VTLALKLLLTVAACVTVAVIVGAYLAEIRRRP
jgi:ABC-type amino acid transport system permease subunit